MVRVLVTQAPAAERQAPAGDAELVCLAIGPKCTGNMCPLGAAEPSAMVRRLVRNGILPSTLETLRAHCPSCDNEVEMILYGDSKACCSVCGSVGRWVINRLEPN
jgi:hypothetical protein